MLTLYGGSSKETDQTDQKKQIIEMLKSNPNIARSEMAQVLGVFGDYASYSPKIFGE